MKMMKWALLGGAAFAVMSTSAQADELTALKAQLDALQARVTELEAQPATSMPSGYSLLSMRDGSAAAPVAESRKDYIDPNSGVTFSVLPSADVAPAAEVSVSAEIRTLLVFSDDGFPSNLRIHEVLNNPNDPEDGTHDVLEFDTNDSHLDVQVRGRLVAQGKVDTAVGEVGARIRIQGGNPFDTGVNTNTTMNQAYGWWKFAPTWQLIAGYWDTTAAIQAGVDWDFTVGATGGPSDKNVEQMRLVYGGDGPFTLAIALEDSDPAFTAVDLPGHTSDGGGHFHTTIDLGDFDFPNQDRGQWPGVAGYLMWNADKLMFQVAGVYQDDQFGDENDWGVGAGARIGLGDMFTLTAAAIYARGYNGWTNDLFMGEDDKFWAASAGLIFNLAEATRLEAGVGYEQVDGDTTKGPSFDQSVWTATGGIYWDPVSQATVGLQANYQDFGKDLDNNGFQVRFGTWLRFP